MNVTHPEFYVIGVNLKDYDCDNLPGSVDMRTDDLKRGIIVYTARSGGATKEQIEKAISVAWKGNEGIKMAETVQKTYYQEVLEEVSASMREEMEEKVAKAKAESTLKILRLRFGNVPVEITKAINAMNDPIALTSLEDFAMDCESLDDFAKSL